MRPLPARILLVLVAASAVTAGLLTSQVVFVIVALLPLGLLVSSLLGTHRRLTQELAGFRNRPVRVRLWGAPPCPLPCPELTLLSAHVIGAGLHIHFQAPNVTFHLKVAQPAVPRISDSCIEIHSARYVQWSGKRLRPIEGEIPLSIAVIKSAQAESPEGAA